MKRLFFVAAALMIGLLLVACGGQETPEPTEVPPTEAPAEPTAEPEPTEEPAAEPTEEPAEEPTAETESIVAGREHTADPALIDITWQWVSRDPNGNDIDAIEIANPEAYTLFFNEDGTFSAQIDCNNAEGVYATSGTGGIFMELGPMTMAICGDESQDLAMMEMFGPVQSYTISEDGATLSMNWVAGGPVDVFQNADMAPVAGEAEVSRIPEDSIEIDLQGLADTYAWQVMPAQPLPEGPGAQGFPPYILVTFDGESAEDALANPNTSPVIYIFPTQAYIDMYEAAGSTSVATQVDRLEELIAEAETRTESPESPMPLLPPPGSFMDRWAQFADLESGVGPGVRYVSDSPNRQAIGVWANDTTNYYYEGLTSDGQFYISLSWPVSTESLPETAADAPEDVAAEADDPETSADYYEATKETLNELAPDAWTPDLSSLDAMVESLTFPTGSSELTGTTWEWVSTTTPVESIEVPNPSMYTITFNDDGTLEVLADCKTIEGEYTAEDSSISILLGPTTLQLCSEESLEGQFTAGLGAAAIYFFDGGDLYLDMMADSGTMRFQPSQAVELPAPEEGEAAGTVTAPDGVFVRTGPGSEYATIGAAPFGATGEIVGISQDGEWYAINVAVSDVAPDGIGWISAEFVDATNVDSVPVMEAPAAASDGLVGPTWGWVNTVTPVETIEVPDPSMYTVTFAADGTLEVLADCKTIGGDYTAEDGSMSITLGPATLQLCSEESLEGQFTLGLNSAATYFFEAGVLFIDMAADAGTMQFVPVTAAPPAEGEGDGGVSGADNQTFALVSFGPEGDVQPVIEGTTITATFEGETVSGTAGCNTYTGTLVPADGYFTVGPVITTRMACAEPEGIMEQEQAYLQALEAINGYVWSAEIVEDASIVTSGVLSYTTPDGAPGVMNFVATQ